MGEGAVAEGSVPSTVEGEAEGLGTTATASVVEEAVGTMVGEETAADALGAVTTASVGEETSGTIEALKSRRVRARVKSRTTPMATPVHGPVLSLALSEASPACPERSRGEPRPRVEGVVEGDDRLRGRWGVRTGVAAGSKAAGGLRGPACALPR